jgi:hypothetical protein
MSPPTAVFGNIVTGSSNCKEPAGMLIRSCKLLQFEFEEPEDAYLNTVPSTLSETAAFI